MPTTTVWVATANIYLGSGGNLVLGYTPGNVVPDEVVTRYGLGASGLVQTATINDNGTSPDWRGTDPITRSELDEALADLPGGEPVSSASDPNTLVRRDGSGVLVGTAFAMSREALNAWEAPSKGYVDALGTPLGTPDTVVRRNADGYFAATGIYGLTDPIASDHAANKGYADALGTSSTSANTIMRRNASGDTAADQVWLSDPAPTDVSHAARKDYVDTGVTAAKSRVNHTGTQTAATISDLTETVQDIVGALIVAGTNTTVTYNDAAGTFTINATASGGGTTDPEIVRDTIGGALVAGSGVQVTVNDVGDTITIASTAVLPTRQVISGTGLTGGGDLSADRTLAVSYGTTAGTAAQGNDSRITGAVQTTDARVTADQAAGTASIRTVGTGALQAAAGNHTHSGLTADQAAGTASVRTLGTGALQAAAGNHNHDTAYAASGHTHTAAQVGAVEAVTTGLKIRVMTAAAYAALGTKDATTLYAIQG